MQKPIIFLSGRSDTGKTASLRNLENPKKKLYLNFESKDVPFQFDFVERKIVDPYQLHTLSEKLIENGTEKFDTLIVDSITACMSLFTVKYMGQDCTDTRAAWGAYGDFYEKWAKEILPRLPQQVIVLAHVDEYEEKGTLNTYYQAVVQGRLAKIGLEADFGLVANTVLMPTADLKNFETPLLNVTEEDEIEGFKYVIQTRKTLDTKDTKIRSPLGMWDKNETYIDSNVQLLLDRFNQYYSK